MVGNGVAGNTVKGNGVEGGRTGRRWEEGGVKDRGEEGEKGDRWKGLVRRKDGRWKVRKKSLKMGRRERVE